MRNDIRKDAYEKIRKLNSNRSSVKFIHYSCGSFTDISEGYSPRINSIAILDWQSGQTTAFSIHLLIAIGSAPADTFLTPSFIIA